VPRANKVGADQVADVGLSLANSTTELMLVLPDSTKVHLYNN
jgi:hypothetical protein